MPRIHALWLASTAAPGAHAAVAAGSGPPLSLTLVLGLTCCAVGLIVGVLVLGFFVTLRRRSTEDQLKEIEAPHD